MKVNGWTMTIIGGKEWKRADGQSLTSTITVAGGTYVVAMFWSPKKDVAEVFDDHAHRYLGRFDSWDEASGAAEAFAKHWDAEGGDLSRCGCAEMPDAVELRNSPNSIPWGRARIVAGGPSDG